MGFTTEAGLQTIMSSLNEGCELVNSKRLRAYIYANDAELMSYFFQLKHGETAELWKAAGLDVPALLDIQYNCSH
jgi:hypothetical protein